MSERPEATILIVDDNPVNLQLLFDYLGREGFRVLVCEDGESAVRQARETRPDIVLMDVLLPGMSGYESCRAIHAQPETTDVPVIFLTALSRTSDKIEGFTAGGVDYLTKPLQFEEVLARVTTHLSLRRLRQELVEKNLELERRDRRREQLFGILAHDLRSPIGACVSGLRLLRDATMDEAARDELIHSLADRVSQLDARMSILLAWGELQIARDGAALALFDLGALLEQIIAEISEEMKEKRINARLEAGPLEVIQDETAVRTVLTNLIANAFKFTPAGGLITVSAASSGLTISVSVTDTGIGMTAEQAEQLFERGVRVHRPGTEGEGGSGLGLLLSNEIAELIGGQITLSSVPDSGSCFVFSFPSERSPEND